MTQGPLDLSVPPPWWPDGDAPPAPDIGLEPDADGYYHWNQDGTGPQPTAEWFHHRHWTHWQLHPDALRPLPEPALTTEEMVRQGFIAHSRKKRPWYRPTPSPEPGEPA